MKKIFNYIRNNYILTIFLLVFIFVLFIMLILFLKKGTYSIDDTTKVAISCPNVISETNEFECYITLRNVKDKVLGIKANYSLPDNIEYVSFSELTGVGRYIYDGVTVEGFYKSETHEVCETYTCQEGDTEQTCQNCQNVFENVYHCDQCLKSLTTTENGFVLVNLDGVTGDIFLGTLKLKFINDPNPNQKYQISLTGIEYSNELDEAKDLDDAVVEIDLTEDTLTIENLLVDSNNSIIYRIPIKTTYESILSNITTNIDKDNIEIKNKNGNRLNKSDIAKTGETITIPLNGTEVKYTISVLGDINGDGIAEINDVDLIYRHIIGKYDFDKVKNLAANIYQDDIIEINDADLLHRSIIKGNN